MSNDLMDKLYQWLEDSGRALELRATRSLVGTPGCRLALPAYQYEDGVTKKQREGDVMALFGGPNLLRALSTSFRLAVECKSGRPALDRLL